MTRGDVPPGMVLCPRCSNYPAAPGAWCTRCTIREHRLHMEPLLPMDMFTDFDDGTEEGDADYGSDLEYYDNHDRYDDDYGEIRTGPYFIRLVDGLVFSQATRIKWALRGWARRLLQRLRS